MQVHTDGVGDCTFTEAQLETTFQAMEAWLDTGAKPGRRCSPPARGSSADSSRRSGLGRCADALQSDFAICNLQFAI